MDNLNFFVPMSSRKLAYSIIGITLREYPSLFLSEDITIEKMDGNINLKECCLLFRIKNAAQLCYVIDSFYNTADPAYDTKILTDKELRARS